MVVCELGSHRCPHIACVPEAVKQHACRALSTNSDMNCRAVGLNLLSTEVGRKYTRGSGDDGDGLFGCIHKGVSFLFVVVVFPGKRLSPRRFRRCWRIRLLSRPKQTAGLAI